jgi:cyclopropane fatty-acyl-phospholipid synthase-like methyltransferase
MDEWWETDALDVTVEKIMRANLKQKITGSWRMRALTIKAVMLNLQAKARSGASVEAHYDIGNDLYTQIGKAIEGTFVLEDLHNIGPDYDPTLMAWWDNFDRTYSEIADKYNRTFYLMWKFYLQAAAGAARARDGQLYQIVLTKTGRKQPDCRAR